MLNESVAKMLGYDYSTAKRIFNSYTHVKDEVLRRDFKVGKGNGAIQFYGADADIDHNASYYTSRGLKTITPVTHYFNVGMLRSLEKNFHELRIERNYRLPKGIDENLYTLPLKEYKDEEYVKSKSSFRINDGRPYFSNFAAGSIMIGSRNNNEIWGIRDFLVHGHGYSLTLIWTFNGELGVFWDFVLLDDKGDVLQNFTKTYNKVKVIFEPQRNLQKDENSIRYYHESQIVTAQHVAIQRKLGNLLVEQYGTDAIAEEWIVSGARRIDTAVLKNPETGELAIYEIKTATTAIECVKQALGQLFIYGYLGGLDEYYISELIVVGPCSNDKNVDDMLMQLSEKHSFKIFYIHIQP